jgi:L-2-hydroxyglutarate oxidase
MRYDAVIIGGGIVGLATALRLSEEHPDLNIAVIEKEATIAKHQTGNNSGVIHSGIYYKPGSLKATNCVEGRRRLLQFCDEHDIHYELCGKIIVATKESELPRLHRLFENGTTNGLDGIKRIDSGEIREYEPHVAGIAGLFVPQTGIIDYRDVARAYADLFQKNGGRIFLGERVTGIAQRGDAAEVQTDRAVYETKMVVNCAGLYSDKIALLVRKELDVRIIPFRGEYYKLRGERKHLIKNLVYPVPDPAFPFLGVHFTRHSDNEVEAGPNAVFAMKREGYGRFSFNTREFLESAAWPGFQKVAMHYWRTGVGEVYRSFSKEAFVRALQKLVPEISSEDLVPGGAGVRAQACARDGALIDDFMILKSPLQIDVLNVPSPAATASLAIAATIVRMMGEKA